MRAKGHSRNDRDVVVLLWGVGSVMRSALVSSSPLDRRVVAITNTRRDHAAGAVTATARGSGTLAKLTGTGTLLAACPALAGSNHHFNSCLLPSTLKRGPSRILSARSH